MSKPMSFDTFQIVATLIQIKGNPIETKNALKDMYKQYCALDPDERKEQDIQIRRKTKPLYLGASAFYNTVVKGLKG